MLKLNMVILMCVLFFVAAHSNILFENGFEGGATDWDGNPWKSHQMYGKISNKAREGNHSVQFLCNPNNKRRELILDDGKGVFYFHKEYWVAFSIMIKEEVSGYRIIHQHHGSPEYYIHPETGEDCGAGPNGFTIKTVGGKFIFYTTTKESEAYAVHKSGATGSTNERDSASYEIDMWYDFVIHFKYEWDGTGYFELWMNGTKHLDYTGVTMYKYDECGYNKKYSFQKIGIYHGTNTTEGEVLYDAFRIGDHTSSYEKIVHDGGTVHAENINPSNNKSATVFVSSTAINYRLFKSQKIDISPYDISGRLIKKLF